MPISVRARQLELVEQPWRMLLVCSALNLTSWRQVDPVMEKFFSRWPDPHTFLSATHEEIVEIIRPLGFYNRRARGWRALTLAWLELENPTHQQIAKLPSVGKYAVDSWRIFIERDLSVEPEDKVLRSWINEARSIINN
jgi:adenine-specific DNA glycosylase